MVILGVEISDMAGFLVIRTVIKPTIGVKRYNFVVELRLGNFTIGKKKVEIRQNFFKFFFQGRTSNKMYEIVQHCY